MIQAETQNSVLFGYSGSFFLAGEGIERGPYDRSLTQATHTVLFFFLCVLVLVKMTWRAKADGKYDFDLMFSLCIILCFFLPPETRLPLTTLFVYLFSHFFLSLRLVLFFSQSFSLQRADGSGLVVIQSQAGCSNHRLLIGFIILTQDLRWERISWPRSAALKAVILMHTRTCTHVHAHTCMHKHRHAHQNTHTHSHAHTHKQTFLSL